MVTMIAAATRKMPIGTTSGWMNLRVKCALTARSPFRPNLPGASYGADRPAGKRGGPARRGTDSLDHPLGPPQPLAAGPRPSQAIVVDGRTGDREGGDEQPGPGRRGQEDPGFARALGGPEDDGDRRDLEDEEDPQERPDGAPLVRLLPLLRALTRFGREAMDVNSRHQRSAFSYARSALVELVRSDVASPPAADG